jgi:FkbM family methyltransferase
VKRDGLWFFVGSTDLVIGREIYAYGSYDEYVMVEAMKALSVHAGRDNALRDRVFIDVGANIGTFTIAALSRFNAASAIAIEPASDNRKLLRCSLIMNDLEDRVAVISSAVSDRSGTAFLDLAVQNWGDHRVSTASTASHASGDADRVVIETKRLDDIISDAGVNPSEIGLVWMDVQGYEGLALSGAPDLVSSGVPIVLEYDVQHLQRTGGLDLLNEIIVDNYRHVVDLRASARQGVMSLLPAKAILNFAELYPGTKAGGRFFTDVLLLK